MSVEVIGFQFRNVRHWLVVLRVARWFIIWGHRESALKEGEAAVELRSPTVVVNPGTLNVHDARATVDPGDTSAHHDQGRTQTRFMLQQRYFDSLAPLKV